MNVTDSPLAMNVTYPIALDMIDWNAGQHMWYGWRIFQAILFPTFTLNTFVIILILTSEKLNSSSSGRIVKYLCLQDATFSLLCAIQCTLNASIKGIWKQQFGCNLQSIYAQLLSISIGGTLALVSYNSHRLVKLKPGLTSKQVLCFHLGSWLVCFLIAYACGAIVDNAPLIPSSLYCFVTLLNWKQGLIFFLPVSCIVAFIIHRYIMLFLYIRRAANSSHFSDQASRAAHDRQLKAAKRMVLLIVLFLATVIPWVIVSVGEVIFQAEAPGMVHLLVGVSVHLNSLFDPIFYLAMTKPAQERVHEIWDHIKGRLMYGRGYQRHVVHTTRASMSPATPRFVSQMGSHNGSVDKNHRGSIVSKSGNSPNGHLSPAAGAGRAPRGSTSSNRVFPLHLALPTTFHGDRRASGSTVSVQMHRLSQSQNTPQIKLIPAWDVKKTNGSHQMQDSGDVEASTLSNASNTSTPMASPHMTHSRLAPPGTASSPTSPP